MLNVCGCCAVLLCDVLYCVVAVAMLLLYRCPGAALWSGADEQCTHAAGKWRPGGRSPMSLWLPCGLHGFAVPNTVTVTVSATVPITAWVGA
jgi:hypothetical protein